MTARLFLSLIPVVLAAPALAQEACTPRDTPDLGSDQRAPVLFNHCVGEGKCGAIDKTGAWRVPPVHRDVMIEEDFIVVPENDDWNKYGFYDQDGKRLGGGDYTIDFEEQLPVSEGLLPVVNNEKMGYVDRTGTLVIPAKFDEAQMFEDGEAQVVVGEKRSFINKTGEIVLTLPDGVSEVYGFSDGVSVASKNGVYGLIGRDGKFVLEPKFSSLYDDHGVLIALDQDSMGIVDRSGRWLSDKEFGAISQFSGGLAPAEKGEKWGFIDSCGNWKIEPKYEMAIGFEGGPARVKTGEKWGLIDKSGAEVYPPKADYIGDGVWTDGLVTFTPDNVKYGVMDTSGKVVIEPTFDSIEPLGSGVLLSYTGEEEKLHNLDGSEIKIAPAP
jgi:hypothetical protein